MSDIPRSPDEPTFMLLEDALRYETPTLDELLLTYRKHVSTAPLWHFLEDAQRQMHVYSNLLEALKRGDTPASLKTRFQELDLLPNYPEIPNPNAAKLAQWVIDKLGQLKRLLVNFVANRGGEFLNELGVEVGGTVAITVSLGLSPNVQITFEHSAVAQTTVRFPSRP